MTDYFEVTYQLTPARDESPEEKARDITLEQTVELPAPLVPADVARLTVGSVESLTPIGRRQWEAVIAFPMASIGTDLTQFLNVLYGNISLKRGIRITGIRWTTELLTRFGGPGFGVEGIRRLVDAYARPILATALKPMGLSADRLSRICGDFAQGGMDIIKDDHGLANQQSAPFNDRVARCQDAVNDANAATGGSTRYFPNVTASWPEMIRRVEVALGVGCSGVLVNPWLTGLDAMRWLRDEAGVAVMAHPALTGAYLHRSHGIAAPVLLGDLFRVAGADAVIYPNPGGRFGLSRRECETINTHLREPLGELAPSLPTPGGGMDVATAPGWARRYGRDTIFLIGGSLYARGDLTAATRQLREAIDA